MKILLLAPHPFYQERGTPIAVDLLVGKLSDRGDVVDVLTYHEGRDKHYENVKIHRINPIIDISDIPPGISAKKLYCDLVLFLKMISMLNKQSYDLIHAVEESATLAMLCKPFTKVPYVYDMDSVITEQLLEKSSKYRIIIPLIQFFESNTIRYSQAVVAVCQAIADYAHRYKRENVFLLKDVSLISKQSDDQTSADRRVDDLRKFVDDGVKIGLYIGNLEGYQGIDLLLDALTEYEKYSNRICLMIIGGRPEDIDRYSVKAESLGLSGSIKFLGPRPIADMDAYMQQADFLLSPRMSGINTPMKIYSYLGSGVPVIATALPTHTQVMTEDIAFLSAASAPEFAKTMNELVTNPLLAKLKSSEAKDFIQAHHSIEAFENRVDMIYDMLAGRLNIATKNNRKQG